MDERLADKARVLRAHGCDHLAPGEDPVRRIGPGPLPRYEVFHSWFLPDPDDSEVGLFGWRSVVWGRRRAERKAARSWLKSRSGCPIAAQQIL